MIKWLLGAIGAFFVWLAWELVGAAIGEIAWAVTAPVRRPIWRAFVQARWPWPLLVMLFGGSSVSIAGLGLAHMYETRWQAGVGVGLFLVGAFFAVGGGYLWRDAQRERAERAMRDAAAPRGSRGRRRTSSGAA